MGYTDPKRRKFAPACLQSKVPLLSKLTEEEKSSVPNLYKYFTTLHAGCEHASAAQLLLHPATLTHRYAAPTACTSTT